MIDGVLVAADGLRLPLSDLTVQEDVEYDEIRPGPSAVRPNMRWVFTDDAGHEHRWADANDWQNITLAVVRSVHESCDGSCGDPGCEGWDTKAWSCSECGVEVVPGWSPDTKIHLVRRSVTTSVGRVDVGPLLLARRGDGIIALPSEVDAVDAVAIEYTDGDDLYRMPFVGRFRIGHVEWSSGEGMWTTLTGTRDPESYGPPVIVAPSTA